jgi:UPF0042 nucleotide-binding protein
MPDQTPTTQHIVLITGPSGAGRSTAINALEDFGFEAIDNIPLSFIPRLVEAGHLNRPLALGLDVRNRDFSAQGLTELHDTLGAQPGISVDLLYLDCAPEVLSRRYSETRRRHPLAPDDSPIDGIHRELTLLEDVRTRADILIDTTELTVHDLRAALQGWFSQTTGQRMAISLHSFSYKRGIPQGLDTVFDVRFLRNPHWEPALRAQTGQDARVVDYIRQDKRYAEWCDKVVGYLGLILPAHIDEGKAHVSLGFGCTGGQHRSVATAESVAQALADQGWQVSIRHRELERRGMAAAPAQAVSNRQRASQ